VTAGGGLFRWKDGREIPDVFHAEFSYPEGFTACLSCALTTSTRGKSLAFYGTAATMLIETDSLRVIPEPGIEAYADAAIAWPEDYRQWYYMMHGLDRSGRPRSPEPPQVAEERFSVPATPTIQAHLTNFLTCARTREAPNEPLSLGLDAATGVHLANLAYHRRRPVAWDRVRRQLKERA
jgi:hypothetical protein